MSSSVVSPFYFEIKILTEPVAKLAGQQNQEPACLHLPSARVKGIFFFYITSGDWNPGPYVIGTFLTEPANQTSDSSGDWAVVIRF